MLEPISYDLDPEQASQYFCGDELKIYSLLWNAAVATHIEGPVIRQHQLDSSLSPKTTLCLKWNELLEPGWSNYLTSGSMTNLYFKNIFFSSDLIPVSITPYNKNRLLSSEYSNDLRFTFSPENKPDIKVKKTSNESFNYSTLIEQMAKYKVARPSTYADRVESTVKNGLIGKDKNALFLTAAGKNLLDKIVQLPAEEQLNKQTSFAIEEAIDQIEQNHEQAGGLLTHFCEKIFKQPVVLAKWLDNLKIEGESLDDLYSTPVNKKQLTKAGSSSEEYVTAGDMRECSDASIINILHDINIALQIKCIEHDWDDFTFQKQFFHIRFAGRLQTRHADRLTVSKEKIFRENLNDFNLLIHDGFWKHLPEINMIQSVDFSIVTDRTKGFLYLEKLKLTYSYDLFTNDDYEIDVNKINNAVLERFSEIEFDDQFHLCSMWHDKPEIVILKENLNLLVK